MGCECKGVYKFIKIIYSIGFKCPNMLYQCQKCKKYKIRSLNINVKRREVAR